MAESCKNKKSVTEFSENVVFVHSGETGSYLSVQLIKFMDHQTEEDKNIYYWKTSIFY